MVSPQSTLILQPQGEGASEGGSYSQQVNEAETLVNDENLHNFYVAINESRREAREHTDRMATEARHHTDTLANGLREQVDRDRKEILAAISASEERVGRQMTQLTIDVSNTRTELHNDIQRVQDSSEANAKEIVKINAFGRAGIIFLSIVGTVAAVAGATAAIAALT
jgi:hypothetical protein